MWRWPSTGSYRKLSVFDYSATTGSSGVLDQTASFGALPVFPPIGDFFDVHRDEGLEAAKHDGVDAKGMAEAIARVLVDPVRADQLAEANLAAAHGMPISEVAEAHMRELALSWCSPVEAPRRAKFAD